jgi:hypothetical protein
MDKNLIMFFIAKYSGCLCSLANIAYVGQRTEHRQRKADKASIDEGPLCRLIRFCIGKTDWEFAIVVNMSTAKR